MMKIARIVVAFSVLATTFAFLGAAGVAAGPLEGRWRLVEQTRGEGRANQVDPDRPLVLEFVREGGRLSGRVTFGPPGVEPSRWPSLLTGAGEIHIETVVVSADEDRVRARYRTDPVPGEATSLEFLEEYVVSDDGRTLNGKVTVTQWRDGKPGGSFVLRRRFERAR